MFCIAKIVLYRIFSPAAVRLRKLVAAGETHGKGVCSAPGRFLPFPEKKDFRHGRADFRF